MDSKNLSQPKPNPLTASLIATIRLARERAVQLADCHEVLHVAVAMLADQGRELDRLRQRYHALLDARGDRAA